ncbi:hypothetical protein EJ02DRAFT_464846 [Clathrospora elynae]|uniref:Uncharacterized protein n=1 Tax=Clathrospora elynae TaxID=706981 RepID=A0A6A5SUW9_9PLEO|nr:hypothetical protein EJ02DRAFT_464846 [Clathrospora elynae]
MSHKSRHPEARKIQQSLLQDEEELDVKKLWGENIGTLRWRPHIRNISTMDAQTKLHECWHCNCYIKAFHLAYCTAIVRNKVGVLDFCGERFHVRSASGCAHHPFSADYNKYYQAALKHGTTSIPQPVISTEDQYRLMQEMGFISVHQLLEFQDGQIEEAVEEDANVNDEEPWTKYTKKTRRRRKSPGREKTKPTQEKKLPR